VSAHPCATGGPWNNFAIAHHTYLSCAAVSPTAVAGTRHLPGAC
jgi:hypothetical protein